MNDTRVAIVTGASRGIGAATDEEIAKVIVWLSGDEASYITGTTILVDGGLASQFGPYRINRLMFPDEFF